MDGAFDYVLDELDRLKGQSPFFYAIFVAEESVDPNLSKIDSGMVNEIEGTSEMRFIPKAASVGTMTAGQVLFCSKDPTVILCVVVGDITLADESIP